MSEDEVRAVDLAASAGASLAGVPPAAALAAASEAVALWAAQAKVQDERRRELLAEAGRAAAEARTEAERARAETAELRASRHHLLELVETLKRRKSDDSSTATNLPTVAVAPPPSPLARIVSPRGALPSPRGERPELFRPDDSVLARLRGAAAAGPRPNSLMEGGNAPFPTRPHTPGMQVVARKYY